jgi:hypothetical protein
MFEFIVSRKHPAVDLQIAAPSAFLTPQRVSPQHAIFGLEVFRPKFRSLDDVGITVKYCKVLVRHGDYCG